MLGGDRSVVKSSAVEQVIRMRRHTSPKRLTHPGPTGDQLFAFICAATAAPDHGRLTPWRFVLVSDDARDLLAEAFVEALRDKVPCASPVEQRLAREKAYRAPTLLLAIARAGLASERVSRDEIMVSLGCAVQNILLTATEAGFATSLTSGLSLKSIAIQRLFDLSAGETAVCFINLGTTPSAKQDRSLELPDGIFSVLEASGENRKHLECTE